jgi:hypothetical protein
VFIHSGYVAWEGFIMSGRVGCGVGEWFLICVINMGIFYYDVKYSVIYIFKAVIHM